MKIAVKKEHIEKGKRYTANCCAVALALLEVLPGKDIRSGNTFVYIDHRCVKYPPQVADFIKKFDNTEPCEPFEFTIPYEL